MTEKGNMGQRHYSGQLPIIQVPIITPLSTLLPLRHILDRPGPGAASLITPDHAAYHTCIRWCETK